MILAASMIPLRHLTLVALLVTSAGAWAYIYAPTVNYLYFYTSLTDLKVDLADMIVALESSNATVTFTIIISNPTQYIGLRLNSIAYQARVLDGNNEALFGLGALYYGRPVDPDSSLTLPQRFSLEQESPLYDKFLGLYNTHGGVLQWMVDVTIGLDTMMGLLTNSFSFPVLTGE